jgi:hypothetical protein
LLPLPRSIVKVGKLFQKAGPLIGFFLLEPIKKQENVEFYLGGIVIQA